jgi:hypothetical protein
MENSIDTIWDRTSDLPIRTQLYFNGQMHYINYLKIMKVHLQHVSVQVFHPQGEEPNASSKASESDKLLLTRLFSMQ